MVKTFEKNSIDNIKNAKQVFKLNLDNHVIEEFTLKDFIDKFIKRMREYNKKFEKAFYMKNHVAGGDMRLTEEMILKLLE